MSVQLDVSQHWATGEAESHTAERNEGGDPLYSYPVPKDDSQKVSCHGDDIDRGSQITGQQQNETKKIESYETDYDRIKQTLNCIKMLYHGSASNSLSKMLKKTPNAKTRKSSSRNKTSNEPSEEKQLHFKSASEALIAEELDAHKEGRIYQETDGKQASVTTSKSEEIGNETKMFNNAECNTDTPLEITHVQKRKNSKNPHHDLQPNTEKDSMSDTMNNIQTEAQKSDQTTEKNYLVTKSGVLPMDTTDISKEERQIHKNKNRKMSKTFTVTPENGSEPITELAQMPNSAQSEASSERFELHGTKNNIYSNNLSQLYAEKRITSDTLTNLLADIHNNAHGDGDSKLSISVEENRRKSRSRKLRDRHQMRFENVERYIASMVSEENAPERETDDILLNKQSLPEETYDRAEEESSNFLENSSFDNQHDFVCATDYPRNVEEQYVSRKSGKQKMTKSHNARSVGSADTLQTATPKKKNKHKKNEKKRNNAGHCTLPVKQKGKINEDVLSVTTKPKKKKVNKLKITDSRNTIGHKPESGGDRFSPTESYSTTQVPYQLWPTDNVVELYHNAATKPGATKSDDSGSQKPEREIKMALPQKPARMINRKLSNLTQKVRKLNEFVINEDKLQEEMENVELLGSSRSDRNHTHDGTEENQPNAHTDNNLSLHDVSESAEEMMTVEVIKQRIPASKSFKKIVKSSKNYEIQRRKTRNVPNVQLQDTNPVPPKAPSFITSKKKNFQLPTLSSQSKHTCSASLQKFDFHTIPFVVGTSITPSHNLGLNIQQTLSIMKLHRPSSGQSPMEIANVFLREKQHTLAGDHIHLDPSLQSKVTTCTEWQSCCPALIKTADTSDVPTKEKAQTDFQDSVPLNEKCLETGKPENPWSLDDNPNKPHAHCTCYPSPPCTDFQSLLSAYLEGGSKSSISEKSKLSYSGLKLQNFRLRNHQNFTKVPRMNGVLNSIGQLLSGREDVDAIPTKENCNVSAAETLENNKQERKDRAYLRHLTDQNKSLKDVLLNLHSDFVRLNNKYEELKITSKNDQEKNTEVLKELKEVEAELEAKEDEITVLMNLYEEVTTLKHQTKALMQRVSNPSLATAGKEGRRTGPRETSVAFLLTRLLRSIQRIQDKLRED